MLEFDKSKLRRLTAKRDQFAAVTRDLNQRLRDSRTQLRTVSEQNRRITTGESFGTRRELNSIEIERAADLGAQSDLLGDELAEASRRFDLINPTVARCENWLREQGPHRGGDYPTPAPSKDTAKDSGKLEKLRTQIEALIEQRIATQDAPLPRAEALRRIDTWIAAQAGEFGLGATAAEFSRHGGQVYADAFKPAQVATPFGAGTSLVRLDFAPLICSLFPEQLKARLAGELSIDESTAIPAGERSGKLASIGDQLRVLEVAEELLVCQLEAAGEIIHRRTEFDPAIVLGARSVDVPPAPYISRAVHVGQPGQPGSAKSSFVSTDRQAQRDAQ